MMIRSLFKTVKQIHIHKYCSNTSISNKDFFRDLANHTLKTQKENSPKDYLQHLKILESKDQEITKIDESLKIDQCFKNNKTAFDDNTFFQQVDNNKSFDSDIQIIEKFYDCNEEIKEVSMENLEKQIEDINLEEIKSLPNELLNVGPIINKNETLKNLLKFGVNLHEIESKAGGSNILVRLDWDTAVLPVISFFKEHAEFTDKQLATIFSKYPRVFRKPLIEIGSLVDYFKARGITGDKLVTVITAQPYVIHFGKEQLERRLKELQNLTCLTVEQMNEVIVSKPRILVENHFKVKNCVVQLNKSFGFTVPELRSILMKAPEILLKNKDELAQNFIFLHRALNLSYEDIIDNAAALALNPIGLSERIKYLIFLKRYQTDPTKELYTPLNSIVSGNEKHFCENVAHTSVSAFRKFLRTI